MKRTILWLAAGLFAVAAGPHSRSGLVSSVEAAPRQRPPLQEPQPEMDLNHMDRILRQADPKAQRSAGSWQLSVRGAQLHVITDKNHDRMRIVTPIMRASNMTPAQIQSVLEANFHSALDARYATSNGILFSVFIHPLSTLDPQDLRSALHQVATLAATFGSSYSSGRLQFGGQHQHPPQTPPQPKRRTL